MTNFPKHSPMLDGLELTFLLLSSLSILPPPLPAYIEGYNPKMIIPRRTRSEIFQVFALTDCCSCTQCARSLFSSCASSHWLFSEVIIIPCEQEAINNSCICFERLKCDECVVVTLQTLFRGMKNISFSWCS
jgi:hypothetical protein